MDEWISVKDRLPEPGIRVLTFGNTSLEDINIGYVLDNLIPPTWSHVLKGEHDKINYWMSLPNPPV